MAVTKEHLEELHKLVRELRERHEQSRKQYDGLLNEQIERYNRAIDDLQAKVESARTEIKERDDKTIDLQARLDALEKQPDRKGRFAAGEDAESRERREKFIKFVRKGQDAGPEVMKALIVADDEQGGYTVPADLRDELMRPLPDVSVMRGRCRVITTSRDRVVVPKLTGSMTWYWTDEESLPAASSSNQFGQIVINTHTGGGLITVSRELLEDSAFDIERFIAEEFSDSLGTSEDTVFLTGTGQGQPEGLLTNKDIQANRVIQTAEAGKLGVDDILDLTYSVDEKYARNGTLMVRRGIAKAIRKMKSGDGQYLWQPSMQLGEPPTFDGHPVVQPSVGLDNTVGSGNTVAVFGNFRYYWIVDRVEISMQRMVEKYAPLIGLYFRVRRGGKCMLDEAFGVLKVQ
ncbi:MAG: phage major capsid protein [Pigmentiphaga sp.]